MSGGSAGLCSTWLFRAGVVEEGKVAQQPIWESPNVLGSALWNLGLNEEPGKYPSERDS